ncbi:putative acetyltransferase [Colletotrichum siamense]|uniref:Acetyltransferase n=1 Tax=Colletotrichum siamense TaxID=690259 RepID=A0A9P5K941_COLSI|nr:putative acetyltransferase [Colletotrichum siamense]KAF4856331.1 putative acetyltransferase [Colletotrichum siamense]KAF4866163.1 putative acetyltransferase [Colletotrichum siamense]
MARTAKNSEIIQLAKELKGTPWCEEYERMISGMLYNPLHPPLLAGRHRARCLLHKYNNMDPNSKPYDELMATQQEMLKDILGKVGPGTFIEPPFIPDYGCNVVIGENCFINFNCTILDTSLVIIGNRVQLGPNVSIYSAGHETSVLSRIKFVEFGDPVYIEDDAWIGGGTIILPGVTIGKGSTIGAGSIVTKSIPPYSVAMGAPAKVVKKLPTVEEELADPNNAYRNMPDRQ